MNTPLHLQKKKFEIQPNFKLGPSSVYKLTSIQKTKIESLQDLHFLSSASIFFCCKIKPAFNVARVGPYSGFMHSTYHLRHTERMCSSTQNEFFSTASSHAPAENQEFIVCNSYVHHYRDIGNQQ